MWNCCVFTAHVGNPEPNDIGMSNSISVTFQLLFLVFYSSISIQLCFGVTNLLNFAQVLTGFFLVTKLIFCYIDNLAAKLYLVQSLFLSGKFVQAADLIKVHRWHEGAPLFTYLMAKCYVGYTIHL